MPKKVKRTIKPSIGFSRRSFFGSVQNRSGRARPGRTAKAVNKAMKVRKAVRTKKPVSQAVQEPQKKKVGAFALLRGFKDIMPAEQKYWDLVRAKVEKLAPAYGFGKIETPILEETGLFRRAVGEDTDIVQKEMFAFEVQEGESVVLRPEATASIVRAYIEHGLLNQPQPVKLWYWGPMFRHDRPQAGRLRQFTQFGFEAIGAADAVIDSQLIILFYKICEELKLDVSVQINSIGCPECRPEYRRVLIDYLKVKKNFLCEDCKGRLTQNPLRVLDCKNEECQRLLAEVPQIVDFLCEECRNHFVKVLEGLDECVIPYNLNSRLVRGLDYYTKTVFEIWPNLMSEAGSRPPGRVARFAVAPAKRVLGEAGKSDDTNDANETNRTNGDSKVFNNSRINSNNIETGEARANPSNLALGGGGRYDGLVKTLGGREATSGAGFAAGVERIILALKKQQVKIPEERGPEVFLAQLGDQARKVCLKLFEDLRKGNIRVVESLSKDGLKPQLEQADKLKIKYTLIVGQKEVLDRTIIIRDMESGVQEVVDFDRAVEEVKKRLK